jgi:hypothetical protein
MNIELKVIKIMAEGVDWSISRTNFYLDYSSVSFVEAVAYLACEDLVLGLRMRYKNTN